MHAGKYLRTFHGLALGLSVLFSSIAGSSTARAIDCDGNGVEDAIDITGGRSDCNGDGQLDECELRGEIRLPEPEVFPLPVRATRLAAGDLDGDGRNDLVVSLFEARSILLLYGRAERRFEQSELALDSEPYRVWIADADNDGRNDILAATRLDDELSLIVLRGTPSGFAAPEILRSTRVEALAAADVDGDGRTDLVTLERDPDSLSILWGRAGDLPESPQEIVARTGDGMAVKDLDGDGDLDIVYADQSLDLQVEWNRGARIFETGESHGFGQVDDIALEDLNEDGFLDTVAPQGPQIFVSLNDGEGGFQDENTLVLELAQDADRTDLADIDSDGDFDIVGFGESSLAVLLNDGSGEFEAPRYRLFRWQSTPSITDIDGDGFPDIASGNPARPELLIAWGEANVLDDLPWLLPVAAERGAAGDVDEDGDIDLAVVSAEGVSVLLNDGGGSLARSALLEVHNGIDDVAIGDADGDGAPDLVVVANEIPSGPGTLAGVVRLPLSPDGSIGQPELLLGGIDFVRLRLADLDGDGDLDFVASEIRNGMLVATRNRGDGTFEITAQVRLGTLPHVFEVLEVDGDGLVDLAVIQGETLQVFRRTPGGSFVLSEAIGLGQSPWDLEAADVDQDGDTDIAAAFGFSVALIENVAGSLRPREPAIGPDNARAIVAVDFEGDGMDEFVSVDRGTRDLSLFRRVEEGEYALERTLLAPGGPEEILAADMNGDSRPDLVTFGERGVSVHINRSLPGAPDENANGILDGCEPAFHRGDANADGVLDTSDAMYIIDHVLYGGPEPSCDLAADGNGDRRIDIADPIYVLLFLYRGGSAPPEPGPPGTPCGPPADADTGGGATLDCDRYAACE